MEDRVLYRACPLCDSPTFADFFTGDCSQHPLYRPELSPQVRWKQCRACSHVFTEGFFSAAASGSIFSRAHENQKVGHDIEEQRMVASRIVERVLPYASAGAWLDVGFGNGALLFTAQEYGFIPIGTDLRVENANALASLGIQAHCQELGALSLGEKCAVISLADVLEHMPYPKDGLRAAHRLLGESGVLFASMPNTQSMVWRALNESNANPYWGEIEHYHNFGRDRLYELLRESGFEPVRYGISERYRACMEVIALRQ